MKKIKTARTSNQTVVARIKPLNSTTALAFSAFYNTVKRNAIRFTKLVACIFTTLLVER